MPGPLLATYPTYEWGDSLFPVWLQYRPVTAWVNERTGAPQRPSLIAAKRGFWQVVMAGGQRLTMPPIMALKAFEA